MKTFKCLGGCTNDCVITMNDGEDDETLNKCVYTGEVEDWEEVEEDLWEEPVPEPEKVYHNKIEVSKHQLLRIQKIIDDIMCNNYTGICVGNATGGGVNRDVCGKACEDICWMMFKNADEEEKCPCHNGPTFVVKENFQELLDYNLSL